MVDSVKLKADLHQAALDIAHEFSDIGAAFDDLIAHAQEAKTEAVAAATPAPAETPAPAPETPEPQPEPETPPGA